MQKADVVLVQPKSGFLDYASKRLPLGIMSIAGLLREQGFNVKIIDQRIDPRGWKKELQHFASQNPLFVGISTMTGTQIHHALNPSSCLQLRTAHHRHQKMPFPIRFSTKRGG